MNKQQKAARKFMQERKNQMKRYYKILKPRLDYDPEYDILYIGWGQKKVDQTLELTPDLRFDVDSKANVVGIEIENFKSKLSKNKL